MSKERVAAEGPAGTVVVGLIGFDVETDDSFTRPELLRLVKQGTKRNANADLALAA